MTAISMFPRAAVNSPSCICISFIVNTRWICLYTFGIIICMIIIRTVKLILIYSSVTISYFFIHEISHMMTLLAFGGKAISFSVLPFPSVSGFVDASDNVMLAAVSLSGLLLPLFLSFLLSRTAKSVPSKIAAIFFNSIVALSLILAIYTCILSASTGIDDINIFLNTTKIHPAFVAAILALIVAKLWTDIRKSKPLALLNDYLFFKTSPQTKFGGSF